MSLLDNIGNCRVDVSKAAVHHIPKLIINEQMVFDDLVRQYVYYRFWVTFSVQLLDSESYRKIFNRNKKIFTEYIPCLPYVTEVSDVYICRGNGLSIYRMGVGLNINVFNSAFSVYRLVSAIIGIMSYIKTLKGILFLWYDMGDVNISSFSNDFRPFDNSGDAFSYNIQNICRYLLGRPKSNLEQDVIRRIVKRREEYARFKSAVSEAVHSIFLQSQEKLENDETPYTGFLEDSVWKSGF